MIQEPPPMQPEPDAPPTVERARRATDRPTLNAGLPTVQPQGAAGVPHPPTKLPRGTADIPPGLPGRLRQAPRRPPASSAPIRAAGTPAAAPGAGEPIRVLIFAPEANRARWIESELAQPPLPVLEGREPRPRITIQLGRRVRTVVFALLKDPPPRPQVLIVDFDAVAAAELFELHAVRHDGWTGRIIGLGVVPPELCLSLEVEQVFAAPFVRDSLLDCVAGTRHAAITKVVPVIPHGDDTFELERGDD